MGSINQKKAIGKNFPCIKVNLRFFGLLLILLLAISTKSQTNLNFNNNTTCNITIDYIVLDDYGSGCLPANICHTGTSIMIPANTNISLPLGTCTNPCGVLITVTNYNGTCNDKVDNLTNTTTTLSNNCSGNTYSISYSPGSNIIFIVQ